MTVTREQVKSALQAAMVLAECIRELGEVPSGHLYAQVMSRMDIGAYESCISMLIHAKLIARSGSHLLVWIGPAKEETK